MQSRFYAYFLAFSAGFFLSVVRLNLFQKNQKTVNESKSGGGVGERGGGEGGGGVGKPPVCGTLSGYVVGVTEGGSYPGDYTVSHR